MKINKYIYKKIINMTPEERAIILYNKYSKDYNRMVVMGKMQQDEHWKEVTKELTKLYKNESK